MLAQLHLTNNIYQARQLPLQHLATGLSMYGLVHIFNYSSTFIDIILPARSIL